MMETKRVLHLRRCVTLLQIGMRSRIVRSHLHTYGTTDSSRGGYLFRCVPQRFVQARLRPESYVNTCRIFSTTVTQSSVDDIDQRLTVLSNDVKKGQVSADDLREMLKLCNHEPRHGMLLLKCCANLSPDLDTSEKLRLIDQVWDLAKKNSMGMTLDHYNTLLHIQMENSNSINPTQFLSNMMVEPDKNTYCLLLNMAAKTGNSKHLCNIMSVIKEKNILFDESTFNSLVQTYVTNGNIAEAEHVITLMRDANLPTDRAYTELACGYAKLGDIPNLIKILNDEPQSNTNLLRITKILNLFDNGLHTSAVLNFLTSSSMNESEISKTITELTRANQMQSALTIINYFALNDATKNMARKLTNTFLSELVMINAPVDNVTMHATNFVNLGYEPLALSNVAEIGLKLGREDLCYAIFKTMRDKGMELRPHYYWPLLALAYFNEGETKVLSIIESMRDTEVDVDFDTLLNHVYPYINTANPHVALEKMQTLQILSSVSYVSLIAFLISQNRMEEAIMLCQHANLKINYKELMKPLIQAYFKSRDAQNCVRILTMHAYGQPFISLFLKMVLNDKLLKLHVSDMQLLLEQFVKRNASISRQDAENLKSKAKIKLKAPESTIVSNLIESLVDENLVEESAYRTTICPQFMTTNDLECFLVELKCKNLPILRTLRRLFLAYCDENKWKKAEALKCEMDANKYQWTYGMKVTLFELYIKNNKLDEAEALLSEINNNFPIDNIKILMFATALVKAGRSSQAFDVINNVTNVNHKSNAHKFCNMLLNTLAHSQYYDETKTMLKLLLDKNYCVIKVDLLRPLIAISLERNDLPQAVDKFKACVSNYKKIPMAMELLTALLQNRSNLKSADVYINEVYNLVADTQNIEVANTKLVIALATLDMRQELQKLLQKESLSINNLIFYAAHLRTTGKAENLMRIFEEMPDTQRINQIVLCDLLIDIYNKTSDYNGALNLWNKMKEKNLMFNEQSKKSFIQLLLLNKVQLPPEFQQDNRNVSN